MSDSENVFDPEKISLIELKTVKSHTDTPEEFDTDDIEGYHLDNSLQFGFNLDEKLVKADFRVEIKTASKNNNSQEVIGKFHLIFIYHIENLTALTKSEDKKLIELDVSLANAISSVTYSTARGILLTRLQGTALQNFILPIINPNKLLHSRKD